MFTGLVEEVGIVDRRDSIGGGFRFRIAAPHLAPQLKIHDSVSINGACHTVVWQNERFFDVESVEETLKKTALGALRSGSWVNLELPLRLNDRLGGHLVLGHVDATGTITSVEQRESSWWIGISIPPAIAKYVIPVGSITIDGVSLTVASIDGGTIYVSIIPHTMEHTIFRFYKSGDAVNIEADMVGKYIERLMIAGRPGDPGKPFPTAESLKEMGY